MKYGDLNNPMIQKGTELYKKLQSQIGNDFTFVGPNDKFRHKCHGCGRCCVNKYTMLFNYDIYRIAKYKGISVREFLINYTHLSLMPSSSIPCVLANIRANGMCVFSKADIEDGFICDIPRQIRPNMCRAFPLGIVTAGNINDDTKQPDVYVTKISNLSCQDGTEEEHLVRDYLKDCENDTNIHELSYKIMSKIASKKMFDIQKIKYAANMLMQMYDNDPDLLSFTNSNLNLQNFNEILKAVSTVDEKLAMTIYDMDTNRPFEDQVQEIIDRTNKFTNWFTGSTRFILDVFIDITGVSVEECLDNNINTIEELTNYVCGGLKKKRKSFDSMINNIISNSGTPKPPSGDDLRDMLRD